MEFKMLKGYFCNVMFKDSQVTYFNVCKCSLKYDGH